MNGITIVNLSTKELLAEKTKVTDKEAKGLAQPISNPARSPPLAEERRGQPRMKKMKRMDKNRREAQPLPIKQSYLKQSPQNRPVMDDNQKNTLSLNTSRHGGRTKNVSLRKSKAFSH